MRVKIDSLQVLKPGEYNMITPGHGKPGPTMPKRCLHCRKLIKVGEMWRSHDNGQYVIIFHSACEAASK